MTDAGSVWPAANRVFLKCDRSVHNWPIFGLLKPDGFAENAPLSFWQTRENVKRYEREQLDEVQKAIQHLLETAPEVSTFNVHTSTAHKLAADKAA